MLRLAGGHPGPVLDRRTPDAADIRHGFEGGRVFRAGGRYHAFLSEMADDPRFVKSRLAHWTSGDGIRWRRESTLFESTADFTGRDTRAALFLPQPVYNEEEGRWNLFYAAFRSAPNAGGQWRLNHDGRIWRAASTVPGEEGLGGPYADIGVVLQPGALSDPWEGLQGVDSFFPYAVGREWYAFYGSARTEKWPCDFWGVGLARAASLAGPWTRCSALNPVRIDSPFIENPIVTPWVDGTYALVYDGELRGRVIGWSLSGDGIRWAGGRTIRLDGPEFEWLKQARTPLGLIPKDETSFELFFTGEALDGYRCMGRVELRLTEEAT